MDTDLEKLAFADNLTETDPEVLLNRIKSLAVTTLHPSIHVVNLHQMRQNNDEPTKAFSARVRSVAANCNLQKLCSGPSCTEMVSYIEETCYHVVMAGLHDQDMKDRALTQAMLGAIKDLPTLVNFATAEESARTTTAKSEISAVNRSKQPSAKRKCSHCGQAQHGEFNKHRLTQCKAQGSKCAKCQRLHHYANMCRSQKLDTDKKPAQTAAIQEENNDPEVGGFLAAICASTISSVDTAKPVIQQLRSNSSKVNTIPVPHHTYNAQQKRWRKGPPKSSPVISVSLKLDRRAYKELELNQPSLVKKNGAGFSRQRRATTDTGAQLTVVNVDELSALGIKKNSIFQLATSVNTVTRKSIDLVGGVFLEISAHDPVTQAVRRTRQMCYVSSAVPGIYLSNEACIDLGCVPQQFPSVGYCNATEVTSNPLQKCSNTGLDTDATCICPPRELPPNQPPELPCQPTVANLPRLKEYILDRYASSAFNCCERQPLPLMESAPPLRIFVDPEASPVAVSSPGTIPLHWEQQVKQGLERDVQLGVIEKVPVNQPVRWCSRMLVTAKHDGSPRRVIDYTQINKHAPRQTHHTKSPYQIAASIPGNKVKSVLDNWHGYHSVPIDPQDRHLTTFLTPYGRYQYRTTPQGLISAGDGYTQRMDLITEGTKDFEHCVDDTILWDNSIEQNFFRVCEFISKCAAAGCIFNPKKFQFALEEVDFLGFTITANGIKPQKQFIDAIETFPTPSNITDVRSWFGLVNQVSYTFAAAPAMEPMRKLLSTKVPFHWSKDLDKAFIESKKVIIDQCVKGVRAFRPGAPTALATDWSKLAVGCWLTQKQCSCPSTTPGCCKGGWQTVFATSKFNTPAVSEYHPIEGEAYAAAWALERCRLFTLGHPNLTLAVDHRPLISILGPNQDLSEIINPRLMNFKLKSAAYRFTPVHVPGKLHVVPDALSRRADSPIVSIPKSNPAPPVDNGVLKEYENSFGPPDWVSQPNIAVLEAGITMSADQDWTYDLDKMYIAKTEQVLAGIDAISDSTAPRTITWDRLSRECSEDKSYIELHKAVTNNFATDKLSPHVRVFKKFSQKLTTLGPVVMLQTKPVIPHSLQQEVMQHLHASHAGANSMFQRALQSVYWPGYRESIRQFQGQCQKCKYIAPSNRPDVNKTLPDFPPYPFHTICMDFFTHAGKNYLVIVDKYSNWLNVLKPVKDDSASVIKMLRQYFSTYGIAEIMSSDGAKVFTSDAMKTFCANWGVTQRISSAYYPQSNKRAEVGVKSAKRLIMDNLTTMGTLDSDKFARAVLIHRNSPDPETGFSPAEVVYGRPMRDHLPITSLKPRATWQEIADKREQAFKKRHYSKCESLNKNTAPLKKLLTGQNVYIQDQAGPNPTRWSKSGTIVEVLPYDSYVVKVHGSNKVTQRNRKFLRAFTPFSSSSGQTQQDLSVQQATVDHLSEQCLEVLASILDSAVF